MLGGAASVLDLVQRLFDGSAIQQIELDGRRRRGARQACADRFPAASVKGLSDLAPEQAGSFGRQRRCVSQWWARNIPPVTRAVPLMLQQTRS